jgi:hypothetical protein
VGGLQRATSCMHFYQHEINASVKNFLPEFSTKCGKLVYFIDNQEHDFFPQLSRMWKTLCG